MSSNHQLEPMAAVPVILAAEYKIELLDTQVLVACRTPDGTLTQGLFNLQGECLIPHEVHGQVLRLLKKIQQVQAAAYVGYGIRLAEAEKGERKDATPAPIPNSDGSDGKE